MGITAISPFFQQLLVQVLSGLFFCCSMKRFFIHFCQHLSRFFGSNSCMWVILAIILPMFYSLTWRRRMPNFTKSRMCPRERLAHKLLQNQHERTHWKWSKLLRFNNFENCCFYLFNDFFWWSVPVCYLLWWQVASGCHNCHLNLCYKCSLGKTEPLEGCIGFAGLALAMQAGNLISLLFQQAYSITCFKAKSGLKW